MVEEKKMVGEQRDKEQEDKQTGKMRWGEDRSRLEKG